MVMRAGLEVQWPVDTNICYMHLASHVDAAALQEGLAQRGVRTLGGGGALRVVTHHQARPSHETTQLAPPRASIRRVLVPRFHDDP
jgi:threonine aldolase